MKNNILIRDDVRRLVVGLDEITVGLHELEAATALDPHPELQCDLRDLRQDEKTRDPNGELHA
jgi:hypothetical protein